MHLEHWSQQPAKKRRVPGMGGGEGGLSTQIICPEVRSTELKHYPPCGKQSGPHFTHITMAQHVELNLISLKLRTTDPFDLTPVANTHSSTITCTRTGWQYGIASRQSRVTERWWGLCFVEVSVTSFLSNNGVGEGSNCWVQTRAIFLSSRLLPSTYHKALRSWWIITTAFLRPRRSCLHFSTSKH
jgi:hypothetical protein